jgi:uncharacterized protein YfeS/predicted DNA-binding WGR domain protein
VDAYRFQDEKSDKFWRIEYAGKDLVVNYGKTGTTGRYQLKVSDSPEACEKEAKKLIAAKVKKGYIAYPEFDPDGQFYLDDDETGPHPLTSHPKFRAHFTADLYYDCFDEEAPFGSDEGADALMQIEDDIRKNKDFDFAGFPQKMVEKYWDMVWLPPEDISRPAVEQLAEKDETNMTQSDMVAYATAFAQIKITGRLDAELKQLALRSLRRMEIAVVVLRWHEGGEPSEVIGQMITDLEAFPAD